jgi:tetratricopeptide (TPR) repeat protein
VTGPEDQDSSADNLGAPRQEQADVASLRARYEEAITHRWYQEAGSRALPLGRLLAEYGDVAGARAAYQQAINIGHPNTAAWAATGLGTLLAGAGDMAGARAAHQLAIDSCDRDVAPRAALDLGTQLAEYGDVAGARAAYQLAIDSHPDIGPRAAAYLGQMLAGQGDVAGARAAYLKAMDSGHLVMAGWAAWQLGQLLAGQGDVAGARACYQKAMKSGNRDAAAQAAANLGLLLAEQGDVAGARAAYRKAVDSGDLELATWAAERLGQLPRKTAGRSSATGQGRGSSRSPALSNRDRVGRGLEFLASGLGPFVHARMAAASPVGQDWAEVLAPRDRSRYGGTEPRDTQSDSRFLLRVMTENWGSFKGRLSPVERGFAAELRDTGNKWAHGQAFSAEDTYRALDTMERLLTAIGAADQASQVRKIRTGPQPPLPAP